MNANAYFLIKKYWGYETFRKPQEEVIQAACSGKDTVVILPTSGGKSLCYQLTALLMPGCCLVVSPLIALIKDQVSSLQQKGIAAAGIYSSLTAMEMEELLRDAVQGRYKLLYVSPERLESKYFIECLRHMQVSLIAVDEAHCISQWGYDFRPAYLKIKNIRLVHPKVPLMALSATATSAVLDDLHDKLMLRKPVSFILPLQRSQLSFSVFEIDSKINKLVHILEKVPGSALVYCNSRRKCSEVAHLLKFYQISAAVYHAGLTQEQRNETQHAWMHNHTRVIVCTNAFGMGIDKPDVRTVVHYDAPDCLENYYQESGRAGRDGKRAYAVLLISPTDIAELKEKIAEKYPSIAQIRTVYQYLVDYLQIPVGLGAEQYFSFDMNEFVKHFKVSVQQAMVVLRILALQGILAFEEDIFLPSRVIILAPRETLNDIELEHPEIEETLKTLLRLYEGIVDNEVRVHEKQIAKFIRRDLAHVIKQLQLLHRMHIIKYTPQKNTPQIYFFTNRAPASDLYIHTQQYLFRKSMYENHLLSFINYMQETVTCRAVDIAAYFNAKQAAVKCGICDNCLSKRIIKVDACEMEIIKNRIRQCLSQNPLHIIALVNEMQNIPKQKFWKSFNYLQAEKLIVVNKMGVVSWTV